MLVIYVSYLYIISIWLLYIPTKNYNMYINGTQCWCRLFLVLSHFAGLRLLDLSWVAQVSCQRLKARSRARTSKSFQGRVSRNLSILWTLKRGGAHKIAQGSERSEKEKNTSVDIRWLPLVLFGVHWMTTLSSVDSGKWRVHMSTGSSPKSYSDAWPDPPAGTSSVPRLEGQNENTSQITQIFSTTGPKSIGDPGSIRIHTGHRDLALLRFHNFSPLYPKPLGHRHNV